jgi:LPXTG-motif cell wall-anchored protein
MFKLRLAAAAAIACAVTLLSSGAQAYPDCGIELSLNDATLVGGGSFTFTADAGDVYCDPWTVTYRGETKTDSGNSISGSYSTPVVTKKTKNKITAKCTHEILDSKSSAPAGSSSDVTPALYSAKPSAALSSRFVTCPVSATVTLLPKGGVDNGDGDLPNTGGSNLWLLVLGGALVVGGGGVTYAARRRHSSH